MWDRLKIEPFDSETQLQPASVDLRLGDSFKVVNGSDMEDCNLERVRCSQNLHDQDSLIRMDKENTFKEYRTNKFIIPPHSFVLATTLETIALPDYISGRVEGRSSIGRIGLFIQNAGWIDPGFHGQITLELFNANDEPILVESGRRICQLVLSKLDKSVVNPYNGKYNGQKGATASRIERDSELE